MTKSFDRWDDDNVRFVLGVDAAKNLKDLAALIRMPSEGYWGTGHNISTKIRLFAEISTVFEKASYYFNIDSIRHRPD